ncbi:hypothetical protein [Dankookia sp. P2]|uniref:hypothetical protein n=1 Tax=Dankookia sp. P2 TaxID=3423955 RepID=UPI003D66A3E7
MTRRMAPRGRAARAWLRAAFLALVLAPGPEVAAQPAPAAPAPMLRVATGRRRPSSCGATTP